MRSRLPERVRGLFNAARMPDSTMLLGATIAVIAGAALLVVGVVAATITRPSSDPVPALPDATAAVAQSKLAQIDDTETAAAAASTSAPRPAPRTTPAAGRPAAPTQTVRVATQRSPFNGGNAMVTVDELEALGARKAGTEGERRAAEYVIAKLKSFGYTPVVQELRLPGGAPSSNVIVRASGASTRTIVVGAHIDASGGAEERDASGLAAALEIARILKAEPATATVEFAFFGSGAPVSAGSTRAHFGARSYVESMDADLQRSTAGMLSLDRIGGGDTFTVMTMGVGPLSLRNRLLESGARRAEGLVCTKDPERSGSSDHEPFEMAGIPAAWLTWQHPGPTAPAASQPIVRKTGQFALDFIRGLDDATLKELCAR